MPKIEFTDNNGLHYMVSVPVLDEDKPMILRMWVAYDRGRRYSQYDYSEVKRGYYLYFSFEEQSPDYPARILSTHKDNCRLYLGEVKRKSNGWHRDFSNLAGKIIFSVIQENFPDLYVNWNNLSYSCWTGNGSGVGLFCDFYKILFPQKEWVNKIGIDS